MEYLRSLHHRRHLYWPATGAGAGGGALVEAPAGVINNWIYSNTSGYRGDGLALRRGDPGRVEAYHNTLADNGGSSGEGVWLGDGQILFYNNLIVGHGVGITATTNTGPSGTMAASTATSRIMRRAWPEARTT